VTPDPHTWKSGGSTIRAQCPACLPVARATGGGTAGLAVNRESVACQNKYSETVQKSPYRKRLGCKLSTPFRIATSRLTSVLPTTRSKCAGREQAAQRSVDRDIGAVESAHENIALPPRSSCCGRTQSSQHRHDLRNWEIGEYNAQRFIAMELLQGETLRQRIDGNPLPLGVSLAN
jgi:hypothetical protein